MELHQRTNRIVAARSDGSRSTIRVRTSPGRRPLAGRGAFDEAEFPAVIVFDIDNDSRMLISPDPNRSQDVDGLNGVLGARCPAGIIRVEFPDGTERTLSDDEEMLHSRIRFFVYSTNNVCNDDFY